MADNDLMWVESLRSRVRGFLEELRSKSRPGFFRYSLSGDLHNEKSCWGLGNTVFAIKILFTLGDIDKIADPQKKAMVDFITSFQQPDGVISDPLIQRLSLFNRIKHTIRTLSFSNLNGNKTVCAETRQSLSSLKLLREKPKFMFSGIPYEPNDIDRYLTALDWSDPWASGSHFSHLLFFYSYNAAVFSYRLADSRELIKFAIDHVNHMQSESEGVWYRGTKTSLQQKINGAMKILTGLKAAGEMNFSYPDRMIDLALTALNDEHSCDNFNVIFVLKCANEITSGTHRLTEIQDFCRRRLAIYREYYHPAVGGFSFYKGKSNTNYYGARITKGLKEPDIHGTCLFLWGITLISKILKVQDQFGFREFTP